MPGVAQPSAHAKQGRSYVSLAKSRREKSWYCSLALAHCRAHPLARDQYRKHHGNEQHVCGVGFDGVCTPAKCILEDNVELLQR